MSSQPTVRQRSGIHSGPNNPDSDVEYNKLNNRNQQYYKQQTSSSAPSPNSHIYAVIALMFTVFIAVIVLEKKLPNGLKINDELTNVKYNKRFISERAMNMLKNLTTIGPRVAGSHENEVLAVNLIKHEIKKIIDNSNNMHIIDVDVQKSSGAFQLTFLDGMTNVYNDVQNIVVRLSSNIKSNYSLLINCHYDTVADSPGASDDGAGCAVMLEMLRVLTKTNNVVKHNIIFLFNGAEENIMQGSHGFITQHKWANEVKAFINLEACGAGGRELLFQSGPNNPWLLETYSKEVPYPYASSMAQEIFQSGIIPGDTDFRIFRDFGEVSGVDFAWSSNGYVYHTKHDTVDQIPLGSLQRTGDNILALVRGIAGGHQLSDIEKTYNDPNLIFFDMLGAFVVRWPENVAYFINLLTVMLSIYSVINNAKGAKRNGTPTKMYYKELFRSSGIQIIAWIISLLTCILIALLLSILGRTMSWYAKPIWICFLYVLPILSVSMAIINHFGKKQKKRISSAWTLFQIYYDSSQILWTLVLLITMYFKVRSGFIALLWVLFSSVGSLMQQAIYKHYRDWKWLVLHCLMMGIPFIQTFYLDLGAIYMFIPVMGRSGSAFNSEIIIAIMTCVMFGLLFSFSNQLILLTRNPEQVISIPGGLTFLAIGLILLTPLGFPYSGNSTALAPQRFVLVHVERTFYDESFETRQTDSGFWIIDMDINSPTTVHNLIPELNEASLVDCTKEIYCGMPYFLPVMNFIWRTHWVSGPKLNLPSDAKRTKIVLTNKKFIDTHVIRMSFTIQGPDHMGLMLSPIENMKLIKWSIDEKIPLKANKFYNRDTYFVYYSYSDKPTNWLFYLDFKVTDEYKRQIMDSNKKKPYLVDISVNGHYMHGKHKSSNALKSLVNKFPEWTTCSYWTSTMQSYKF